MFFPFVPHISLFHYFPVTAQASEDGRYRLLVTLPKGEPKQVHRNYVFLFHCLPLWKQAERAERSSALSTTKVTAATHI